MARTAWVLNLDAEDELRLGDAHTTARATRTRIGNLRSRLGALVGDDAVLIDPWDPVPGTAIGLQGRAWCPTPRALVALSVAGATLPDAPAASVLREVNHRRFASSLGVALPGARFATSLDEIRDVVLGEPEGDAWLVKPALGFAGRGHLRVPRGPLDDRTARAIAELVAIDGGAQIEPLVAREGDFALHGEVARDGTIRLGLPTATDVDERGTWRATRLAERDELTSDERDDLARVAEETGRALFVASYVGPFNVDAFRWRDRKNRLKFASRCEVNARFSMGWAVGMAMLGA